MPCHIEVTMIIKPSILICFSLLSNTKYDSAQMYQPYTTTKIVTNSDIYNVDEILQQLLIDAVKQENK